jgi:hypothetical protein
MVDAKKFLAVFLSCAVLSYAKGNTFTKVRYNGGSVASAVNPKDWNNKLTITPEAILLELKDQQRVEIAPKSVTTISYGQEAHRRVGTMIALAILVAPVALFGLFHKTRLHFIGVQYKTQDGKSGGLLLQADKDNYRAMLVALQGVTGAPISVAEKEREYLPVGVTANVTRDSDESKVATKTPAPAEPPTQPQSTLCSVTVVSKPAGATIMVDGYPAGITPAVVKLMPGTYKMTLQAPGLPAYTQQITVEAGQVRSFGVALDTSK